MATLTDEERDAKVEQKQQKTEEQEAEKKEQKEAEKSEHEDKYFVVHGGTCVCDKAVDPSKEAEIVVTVNQQLVINEDNKKFAATEEDKTLKPPAATFGKCKLKPSNSDYLPCAPAFAPKWEKAYDKKTVQGKKILTELSTLQCTIGGKISIKKHGQEDSVVKEHAENTDEAEQALINPAVPLPVLKPEYPSVSSIDLKVIAGRTDFKEVKSSGSTVKKISIRVNEEATFNANLKKGNTRLTSWIIYQLNAGKVGEKLITSEQVGTTFKNTFPALGTYRVEGYGKPKTAEFENGKYNKNYTDCSIDVEVIVNKLNGTSLQAKDGDSFTRKNSKSENKLRKGFPATFEAKFLLEPNAEEIQNLNMFATDGSGNVIISGTQSGNSFAFTPANSDGKYTITAIYTNPEGKIETQTFSATTESAFVNGISHGAEVVRPEIPMTFKVTNTQFKTGNLSSDEANAVKWNLNGQFLGKGSSITIPGNHFLKEGKYVVEAYVKTANATGLNAKNEEDDWHFEVKKNDVTNIVYVGQPKVGKTTQLKVDKFIMPPIAGEKVVWNVFGKILENSKNTYPVIDITPGSARKENITCKINNQKGVTKSITIVEAEIVNAHFTDNNNIKLENASWNQKVNILIEQKHLIGEEINIEVFDYDYMSGNDSVYKKNIKKFDGKLVSFKLDKAIKEKTGTWGKLFFKVTAPHLTLKNADKNYPESELNVKDEVTFSNVILGEEDGLKQHAIVDYDKVSWFYANTTGIKEGEELTIEIWESVFGLDTDMKLNAKAKVGEDGVLKAKIQWNKIPKIKTPRRVYAQVKDKDGKVLYDADGGSKSKTDSSSKKSGYLGGAASLLFVAAAVYMVDNMAAVVVGTQALTPKTCFCKNYDLIWGNKVNCDFRKKVVEICNDLWGESRKIEMANGLMAVMNVETGGSFKAHQIMGRALKDVNQLTKDDFWLTKSDGTRTSRAVGLIQFTQTALVQIGEFTNGTGYDKLHEVKLKFAKMGEVAQLDYVKKYFQPAKDKIKTPEDIYLQVFAPSGVGKEDDYVLYSEGTEEYRQNKSIDEENNGDGEIQRSEILGRYNTSKNNGASNKASDFTCQNTATFNAKDIITYRIYSDGRIEKHTPKVIKDEYKTKYKYIYLDKNNLEHEICIVDFVDSQNWVRGSKINGGNGWETRVAGGKTRYYLKGEGTNVLVKIPLPLNYSNNGVVIKYSDNTTREYMNPKAFASILGALAECNYNDVTMNGFTSIDGTGAPSVSHINGIAGDFRYLRKDMSGAGLHINLNPNDLDISRQETLIDAFVKFGYSSFLSFNITIDGKAFILKKSSHLADHHHHIHLNKQGYSPNYLEINES